MRFSLDSRRCVSALVGVLIFVFAIGLVALGYQIAKHRYNKPFDTKVERDTVCVYDTIPHYYPQPVEVEKLRTEYRWLTRVVTENVGQKKISVDSASFSAKIPQDSVLVEVPIESKHYSGKNYDAYVSGYETNLDSIKVYSETQYITETIEKATKTKRKPWGIGFHVGYGYDFKSKTAAPFVGVGISYDIISF